MTREHGGVSLAGPMSRKINIPVTPVTSLITLWSWRFISVNAFCIRWIPAAASSTRVSRWRIRGPERGDLRGGPEAAAQQTKGVELLDPLAVGDIALAARHVQGADPNIANHGGWTPLYLATDNRNIEAGDYPVRRPTRPATARAAISGRTNRC